MTPNFRYWRSVARDAEAELDAATRLSDVKIAARRLVRAREALVSLEAGTEAGRPAPAGA